MNVHGAPSSENIYFILQLNIHCCMFHGTIINVLIDTGSPNTCSLFMYIVPHPSIHGAPSSGLYGHLLD